jgi:hypothetical protein
VESLPAVAAGSTKQRRDTPGSPMKNDLPITESWPELVERVKKRADKDISAHGKIRALLYMLASVQDALPGIELSKAGLRELLNVYEQVVDPSGETRASLKESAIHLLMRDYGEELSEEKKSLAIKELKRRAEERREKYRSKGSSDV